MLKKYKWRLILSSSNLIIAVVQSAFGLQAAKVILRHRHDNIVLFIPTPQVISDCINAPSFIFSNLIGNTTVWRNLWGDRWLGAHVFYEVAVSFYVMLSLFWWWVGWRFDTRSAVKKERRAMQLCVNVLGAVLSLGLLCIGLKLALVDAQNWQLAWGGLAIPISTCLWGCLLTCYFVRNLIIARGLPLTFSPRSSDV